MHALQLMSEGPKCGTVLITAPKYLHALVLHSSQSEEAQCMKDAGESVQLW